MAGAGASCSWALQLGRGRRPGPAAAAGLAMWRLPRLLRLPLLLLLLLGFPGWRAIAQEVNCLGEWGVWSDCSLSCSSDGTLVRTFYHVQEASSGGAPCIADDLDTQTQACPAQPECPVDCAGAWGAWSECSVSCGSGEVYRTFWVSSNASQGGAECKPPNGFQDQRSLECTCEPNCPVECNVDCVGYWQEWDSCSATVCGETGLRGREYLVAVEVQFDGVPCPVENADDDAEICELDCSNNSTGNGDGDVFSDEAAIGIGAGIGVVVVLAAGLAVFCVLHKRRAAKHAILPPKGTGGRSASSYRNVSELEEVGLGSATRLPGVVLEDIRAAAEAARVMPSWAAIQGLIDLLAEYQAVVAVGDLGQVSPSHGRSSSSSSSSNSNGGGSGDDEAFARHGSADGVAVAVPSGDSDGGGGLSADTAAVVGAAHGVVQRALKENHALMDRAVREKDFRAVARFNERAEKLVGVLPSTMVASAQDSSLECVVPGLLLRKDRFEGSSDAFLGRGASAAVSRGVLLETVGTTEVRTAVAVKEVQKKGVKSEQKAMREFLLLTKKLQPQHANIIRLFSIKANSSTFFVIMEFCAFSLDKIPPDFRAFLLHNSNLAESGGNAGTGAEHSPLTGGHKQARSSSGGSAGSTDADGRPVGLSPRGTSRRASSASVGHIVLNALVQDLVRGAAFLHSKQVVHCDIKPANVLCAFDRDGKPRERKAKYFKRAQLKLTDFGVSRVVEAGRDASNTTATVSLDALVKSEGIAGSEAYMSPEVLATVRAARSGGAAALGLPEVTPDALLATDAFACGCVVGFLCSGGTHPFQSAVFRSIPDNVLAGRRMPLRKMGIVDARHLTLVDRMTLKDPKQRWSPQKAMAQSTVFDSTHTDAAQILLQNIELRTQPAGSCRDQLMSPQMLRQYPRLSAMVEGTDADSIDQSVRELLAKQQLWPVKLDVDSLFAIVAYTFDNQVERTSNVYFALNNALRRRETDPAPFQLWQGFLFYLMRALDKLPRYKGIVYRGGNKGLHQRRVKREYKLGRPVQWAAFSSTSQSEEASKAFVHKREGVVFRITVVSGTDIGRYSHIPTEGEVLLSPNTRFTVTRELFVDGDGYSCVDLAESKGLTLSS